MLCNLDGKERSYICEASKNPGKIFESMAKLLAHPLQRCKQKDSFYSIVDTEMQMLSLEAQHKTDYFKKNGKY